VAATRTTTKFALNKTGKFWRRYRPSISLISGRPRRPVPSPRNSRTRWACQSPSPPNGSTKRMLVS
jgi:hypothetical protein